MNGIGVRGFRQPALDKETRFTGDHDTIELQHEVARNRDLSGQIDRQARPLRTDAARLDTAIGGLSGRIKQLKDAEVPLLIGKRKTLQGWLLGLGGLGSLAAAIITGSHPALGIPMVIAGVGSMLTSLALTIRDTQNLQRLRAESVPLQAQRKVLESERTQVKARLASLDASQQAADRAADAAARQLDVVHMANAAMVADGAVEVRHGAVNIRGISIPRKT